MPAFDSTPDHLLQTKLYAPRVPSRVVRRQALLDRLEDVRDRPLTLVSAPAGYGKSTLITQWLDALAGKYAWLSLDEHDSGLDIFLSYLIAALQTAVPDIGQETKQMLGMVQDPAPQRLADMLLVELQHLQEPLCLVLDDYHTVSDPSTHLFMMRFMQRLPRAMHLVIIARADPPLGLQQLRGRGRLREIRGSDLRFSFAEAALLIEQIVERPVAEETAAMIAERTEGWPVGLRMAAMSLRAAEDPQEFTRRYSAGGQKLVSDYLLGEVLERLPDEQRLLLLRTAIVDRFCAPLIDALAGESLPGSSGYDFLQALWTSNFFLIALDVQGTWYRYHHLFRQLLQQQLQRLFSAAAIAAIQLRASAWFEDAGYIEEAIIHAVKGGEPQSAARLVEEHVHEAINQEEWRRVERWVNLLPREAQERPAILAVRAMLEQFRFQVGTMVPLLDAAQEGLTGGACDYTAAQTEAWLGVINAFRATVFLPENSPRDSLHYAHQAMRQVDPSALYVLSIAEFWFIYALQQSGRMQEGIRLARQKIANQIGPPDVRTNRLMLALGALYFAEADVTGLRSLARAFLELAARSGHQLSVGWAHFFLGWCAYQENKLSEAESHFSHVVEIRYLAHVRAAVDSLTGLVLTKCAMGEVGEAQKVLQLLREFIVEQGTVALLPVADSLALRIKPLDARSTLLTFEPKQAAAQLASDLWELPMLTACRVAIARGEVERLAAVEARLARCRDLAQSRNLKRQLIGIGVLQALLQEARGDRQLALARLSRTVLLGETGGVLRSFVDEGPGLLPLLRELRGQGVAPSYIERILAAYPQELTAANAPVDGGDQEQSALSPTAVALMSEITNREMEVLLLLAERLTNKEIAAQLHISPRTVKKHTINLYQKLEVENRRQAVARAREVGVISN